MAKTKILNIPMLEALIVGIALHVIALVALGGRAIWKYYDQPEADFEAAPIAENVTPPPPPITITPDKQQARSARPTRVISVQDPGSINLPSTTNIDLPDIALPMDGLDVAGDGGGSVLGNFARGSIKLQESEVNFFSIRESGERVVFILDTSNSMLKDDKGGLNAYKIVKDEIGKMIGGLPPGTLFNVLLFSGRDIEPYQPKLIEATPTNKQGVVDFLKPVNEDPDNLNNDDAYSFRYTNSPIVEYMNREEKRGGKFRGIQAAMEMNPDAIFFITSGWMHNNAIRKPQPPDFDEDEYLRQNGWTEKTEKEYQEAVDKARKWLERENKKRKEQGKPPKIVPGGVYGLVRELGYFTERKPVPPNRGEWDLENIASHFRDVVMKASETEDYVEMPKVHVVAFLGKDEKMDEKPEEQLSEFVRRFDGEKRILNGLPALQNVTN